LRIWTARDSNGQAGISMMAPTDSQFHSHVIVVADRHNHFLKEVDHLAAEYGLAVTPCDDIYSAATELAGHPDRFLMVTGMFRRLTREKGDFFALARRHGVPCCCLLDAASTVERDRIAAAVRLGARLAGQMADIRRFLEDRLAIEGHRDTNPHEGDSLSEQFRATEDELKVLLRQETDGE
jgi:hypothetical protein